MAATMRSISRRDEMSLAEPAALPVATSAAPRLHVLKRFVGRFNASLPAYLLLLPSLVFLALFTYGAMGRVLIDQDNLVVHSHDFLDTSLRFPFEPPAGVDGRDYALNFPAR